MPWSQPREPGRVAGDETEPTGKRDENTKRIRREYERNTKRIRRQRASNPPATRLYHTCKWLVLPGPAPFCVGIQLARGLPQARSGRNGRRRASLRHSDPPPDLGGGRGIGPDLLSSWAPASPSPQPSPLGRGRTTCRSATNRSVQVFPATDGGAPSPLGRGPG
jgi:hypothetical protein